MFKKPFKVKSNTQMKNSDKKKLKIEIKRCFPTITDQDVDIIVPNKEEFSLVKVATYNNEIASIYCAANKPILFTVADKLYPTVYLLWEYTNLLPFFTTSCEVVTKIKGGADFMAAGILATSSGDDYGRLNKFDRVYLNVVENRAAFAVGQATMSSNDMYMSAGHGKCVRILHVYEDELSKLGTALRMPSLGPISDDTCPNEVNNPPHQNADNTMKSYSNAVENLTPKAQQTKVSEVVHQLDTLEIVDENKSPVEDKLATPDDVLMYCFLKALNTTLKNTKFPLLISTFYKVHMIPCCPSDKVVDIKKTKYKKLSKFVEEMTAENIIKVEEHTLGVQSLISVNYSHYMVSGFVDCKSGSSTNNNNNNNLSTATNDGPKVSEKYVVTTPVLPIFSEFLIKKGEALPISDARKYITEYIRKYKLPVPDNPSLIQVNDDLKSIMDCDSDVNIVKWEDVIDKVLKKMSRSYKVETNAAIFSEREQKGKLPHIDVRIVNKMGNKKVTLVSNLEVYGINLDEFSKECSRGVAASTTINSIPGQKGSQLQIQGFQIPFLEKILTGKYKVPKKYINGLNIEVKKKKKK